MLLLPVVWCQVSHRPPVTAMYFENRPNHLVMNAQVWTKYVAVAVAVAVDCSFGAPACVAGHVPLLVQAECFVLRA